MAGRDRDAFAEFVSARSGALHRAAYLMVGDAGLAQDLVQEALTKTYVAWPRLRDPANAEAYTRKAITTTAITWFRRKSWGERPAAHLPDRVVAGHAEAVDDRAWLWDALQALPARQRVAVVLRHYEDLSEAQTAAAMGCSLGTVKSQTSAGLAKLRDRLRDDPALVPDLVPVDVDAITGAAERTVRRRRAALAAGVLAGVVALVALGAAVRSGGGGDRVAPAPAPGLAGSTWATGSVLHLDGEQVDVGRPVDALVDTGSGVVFLSGSQVWSVDVDGPGQIGSADPDFTPRLVADDAGHAAWVEVVDGVRTVAVVDQVTGERSQVGEGAQSVTALADGTVYWNGPDGLMATDLATGQGAAVPGGHRGWDVVDVAAGVTASTSPRAVRVGPLGGEAERVPGVPTTLVDLSPDGRWVAAQSDLPLPVVTEVATGASVPFDLLGHALGIAVGWIDADTVLVAALEDETAPVDLLACEVPAGTCTSLERTESLDDVVLPMGRRMDDL